MSRSPLCCTFILLMVGSLVVPSLRAQCSDCVGLGGEFDVPLVRVEKSASAADRRARAQAGDVTAVAIPEGTDAFEEADSLRTRAWRGQPGSTINTPTAFGPKWGEVYAGVSYQHRIRYSRWRDGIVGMGVGFGNPHRTVGLAAAVTVLDTYTDFGEDRSLSLKVHRRLPWRSAVALGYENLWHTAGTDGGDSRYGVVSTVLALRDDLTTPFGSVVVSGGLGEDRFLSEGRFARGERGTSLFGSLGLRVLRSTNAIVNWSGQDLNVGLSVVPHSRFPVMVTPAVLDVTGRAGDGARFGISAAIGYDLRR